MSPLFFIQHQHVACWHAFSIVYTVLTWPCISGMNYVLRSWNDLVIHHDWASDFAGFPLTEAHEQPSDNEQMIRFIQKIITHDQDLLIQTSYRTLVVIFKQVNLMTLMSEKKTSPRNQMKVIVSQGRSASLSWGVLEQPESCYSKDSSVSEWSFDANHHKVMMYILYIVESISTDTACLGIFVDISIVTKLHLEEDGGLKASWMWVSEHDPSFTGR